MARLSGMSHTILYIAHILIKLIWVLTEAPEERAPLPILPEVRLYPEDGTDDEDDADDDYDYDDEQSIYDEIDEVEEREPEKQTGNYYLGGVFRIQNLLLMNATVSPRTFFRYDFPVVCRYIWNTSTFGQSPEFHIMKLHITETGVYQVVLKTTWIRLVQRAWKRRFAEQKRAILMCGSVFEQEYFRMNGRYRVPRTMLSLRGLIRVRSINTEIG